MFKFYLYSKTFSFSQIIKDYLYLDLLQGMPGCSAHKIRHLYLEDSLKLKDAQSNKIDVHCFLFTDIFLVCKSLSKKASSSECKVKVIRQPFVTDRLVVRELKDGSGFLMIYLNELNVASSFLLLYTAETRTWVDGIRRAQEDYRNLKYSSEQEAICTYQAQYNEDENSSFDAGSTGNMMNMVHGNLLGAGGGGIGSSPRSSSRSSLIHSHSGSQDMTGSGHEGQGMVVGSAPSHYNTTSSGNMLTIAQAQPPRAVSFELGDLRNPSLVVEDAESFARSQSVETRSPVAVTITSPRPERRAFLLRNTGGGGSSGSTGGGNSGTGKNHSSSSNLSSGGSSPSNSVSYLSQNSLSVSVPSGVQGQQQQTSQQPLPMPRAGRRAAIVNSSTTNKDVGEPVSPSHHPANLGHHQLSSIQVAVTAPPPSPPLPSTPSPQKGSRSPANSSSPTTTPTPPPPPPSPPSPPSLMSISSRGSPLTMTINKPPLVKTKNVSCGVASLTYAGQTDQQTSSEPVLVDEDHQQHLHHHHHHHHHPGPLSTGSFEGDNGDQTEEGALEVGHESEEYLKNSCTPKPGQTQQQPKRTCRPDRRYHTADSIEHMKKEKDNSIHKRLSWNYGQQSQAQQHCCSHHHSGTSGFIGGGGVVGGSGTSCLPQHSKQCAHHCLSCESVYSSSGFSSTGSVALSVGSTDCGTGSAHNSIININNNNNPCSDPNCCCKDTTSSGLQGQPGGHFDEEEEYEHQHNSAECLVGGSSSSELHDRDSALPNSPAMCFHAKTDSQCSVDSNASVCSGGVICNSSATPNNSSDIKIDVSEVKDGISSVQITLSGSSASTTNNSNIVSRPSKADLKKMKEFLLSNCNVESS